MSLKSIIQELFTLKFELGQTLMLLKNEPHNQSTNTKIDKIDKRILELEKRLEEILP